MSQQPYPHWHAEVERLRATFSELGPAAKVAVREVLLSVLAEDSLDPRVADSARTLLVALGRLGVPAPAPSPHRADRPAPARAGSRLLAIARGRGRLASAR